MAEHVRGDPGVPAVTPTVGRWDRGEITGFRLSWGAVFAGLVTAIALQVVLTVLGLAIGLGAWDPSEGFGGIGTGVWVWALVSALASLFAGGVVTGRLAGILTPGDGALHGLLMWGLSLLVGLWLVGSGAGFVLGTAFDVIGSTVASAAGATVSGVAEIGVRAASGTSSEDVQSEIESILRATGVPALQPERLEQAAGATVDTALQARNNREAAREIGNMISQRAGQVDRQAIVNVIAARTQLSRSEADQAASRIEQLAMTARSQAGSAADTLGQRVTEAADDATDFASTAAWWFLLWLLVSAAGAGGGAMMQAKR